MTPAQQAYWAKTECRKWAAEAGIPLEQQFEDLEDLLALWKADPANFDPEEWLAETWGIEPDHIMDLVHLLI